MKCKLLLTGGGTAGHVMPNVAILEAARQSGEAVVYIGSYKGIERTLIIDRGVKYYPITTGKLRRYWSWRHLIDPFKLVWGFLQSVYRILRLKPDVVFSSGGYVAVPVVLAARTCRIPVVIHESNLTPGLATRICAPFSTTCLTYEVTQQHFKGRLVHITGSPLRVDLLQGDAARGRALCGFNERKPILFVCGGSLGSQRINETVREALSPLLTRFQIAHVCGQAHIDRLTEKRSGYRQFAYLGKEYADVLAAADLVVSRSGANAVYELIALQKPHVFIPLGTPGSRGEQVENARYFVQRGTSLMLEESKLSADRLVKTIDALHHSKDRYSKAMAAMNLHDGTETIWSIVKNVVIKRRHQK